MKKQNLVLALMVTAAAVFTACSGGGGEAASGQKQETKQAEKTEQAEEVEQAEEAEQAEETESETEEAAAETVQANWTIDEAVSNQMRFDGRAYYTMYAEGTSLYAAPNAVYDTYCFDWYARLVTEGKAGSQIRQIQTEHYRDSDLILDSEGRLWYNQEQLFEGYNLQYFDCFYVTSATYRQFVAGVTADGGVVYHTMLSDDEVYTAEGLANVKYVDAFWDKLAVVRQDGTAAYMSDGDAVTELDGWTDMAMIYMNGEQDEYTELIGLKQDGTVVAQAMEGTPVYPEEILSWTDIVWIIRGSDYVAGLKSDGSFVYALEADADDYTKELCEETYGTWTNVMAAAEEAAITADGGLLGDAQLMNYGWKLENPYTDREAAELEGELDEDGHTVRLTRLPALS